MQGDTCTGVWSEAILDELGSVRPARYVELAEDFWPDCWTAEGRLIIGPDVRPRLKSLKMSNYHKLMNGVVVCMT